MEINYIGDYNVEFRDADCISNHNYTINKIINNKNTSEIYISWYFIDDDLEVYDDNDNLICNCNAKLKGNIIITIDPYCLIDYMYHYDEFINIMYDIQDIQLVDFEIEEITSNTIDKNILYNYIKNMVSSYFLNKNANFEIEFNKI